MSRVHTACDCRQRAIRDRCEAVAQLRNNRQSDDRGQGGELADDNCHCAPELQFPGSPAAAFDTVLLSRHIDATVRLDLRFSIVPVLQNASGWPAFQQGPSDSCNFRPFNRLKRGQTSNGLHGPMLVERLTTRTWRKSSQKEA